MRNYRVCVVDNVRLIIDLARCSQLIPLPRLYGVTLLQGYLYYRTYQRDSLKMKLLVSDHPLAVE